MMPAIPAKKSTNKGAVMIYQITYSEALDAVRRLPRNDQIRLAKEVLEREV